MAIVKITSRIFCGILLLISLNSCDIIEIFDDDPDGSCTIEQPTAGTHLPSQTQIVWNWNTVAGASGYKFNTEDNFPIASDNGTSTSYAQTVLTCNTAYTLYVWAYNDCGNSTSLQLGQTTSACNAGSGETVTFIYRGNTVTYGTETGANGRYWLDRNLGAEQVATSSNNTSSYGDLFQWGRLDDGHQEKTSSITSTQSNSDVPGHNMLIDCSGGVPWDWRSPQNDNLWQGVNGINNPCPDGYRVPTDAEWETERQSWSSNNDAGAFASPLKLPSAGHRSCSGYFSAERDGFYWSSTVNGTGANNLHFASSGAVTGNFSTRDYCASVRCIKD